MLAAWLVGLAAASPVADVGAQALPDPARAKALDKCHILVERTGAKLAVKKLKALDACVDGIHKCLQTKPGDARCVAQARERCHEQLAAAAAEEAKLVDVVVRKCGSDLAIGDLLDPAGLDLERLRGACRDDFATEIDDLAGAGTCLARQHACELEAMFAVAAPRAATLLAVAGVDPAARAALACLTDHGGADEHVDDPKREGRPVERCARAIKNAGRKLVDASLKATGRCLDTILTCVQVKHDPAAAPACLAKARKRCDVELANLAAAAARPAPALVKACGALDFALLRSAAGLRLAALAETCAAVGGADPVTLAAYADCLVRTHRCGVAALARFKSPRADALLAHVGLDLASLCPTAPTATPTPAGPTGSGATATPSAPPDATATPATTATPTVAASPGGCADAYEPNAFPAPAAGLDPLCPPGGCTDEGYDLYVDATIDDAADGDFYRLDVTDLAGETFQLQVRLEDIPSGTNYDLYLYRIVSGTPTLLDQSTNDGTGSETVAYDPNGGGDHSGTYGIEVRRIAGASCETYRLEIRDPS